MALPHTHQNDDVRNISSVFPSFRRGLLTPARNMRAAVDTFLIAFKAAWPHLRRVLLNLVSAGDVFTNELNKSK
jgi:hypothetical protein